MSLSSPSPTISLTCVGVRNRQELVPIVIFPCYTLSDDWSIFNIGQGTFGISSSLSPTHICLSLVMDRQGISSPVFHKNDGVNNYITEASIFNLQRQMQGAQSRLRERIENISIDIRHSEARKRDYIDKKLSAHKEECRCQNRWISGRGSQAVRLRINGNRRQGTWCFTQVRALLMEEKPYVLLDWYW